MPKMVIRVRFPPNQLFDVEFWKKIILQLTRRTDLTIFNLLGSDNMNLKRACFQR